MKIFDLTHTIANDMTVFPGVSQPENKPSSTIDVNGYNETTLHMHSHNGTHMDSSAHVLSDGTTLDNLNIDSFTGMATLIDCTHIGEGNTINMDLIETNIDNIKESDFIIFHTGWSKYWNTEKYLGAYPVLSEEVIDYLVTTKKKGIGFDTISLDPIDSPDLAKHQRVLGENILIIENLANLDSIDSPTFVFFALPLKFKDSDGAPVRAIAMVD